MGVIMRVTTLILLAVLYVLACSSQLLAQPDFKEQLRNAVIAIPTANLGEPPPRIGITVTTDPDPIGAASISYKVNANWTEGGVEALNNYAAVVEAGDKLEKGAAPDPTPDLILKNTGWLYVNGIRPVVGTKTVTANAEGSTVGISIYTDGSDTFHRVYYVEGDPSKFVWVYPRQGTGAKAVLTVGTFVDAKIRIEAGQPVFDSWKQPPHGVTQRPIPEVAPPVHFTELVGKVLSKLAPRN
jgi:hypothetical protein